MSDSFERPRRRQDTLLARAAEVKPDEPQGRRFGSQVLPFHREGTIGSIPAWLFGLDSNRYPRAKPRMTKRCRLPRDSELAASQPIRKPHPSAATQRIHRRGAGRPRRGQQACEDRYGQKDARGRNERDRIDRTDAVQKGHHHTT
jgi:hypothetical protein